MTKQAELLPATRQGEAAVQPANYTPMAILATAVERGADIGHLEKLMDLQERWEDRESKKAFDKALAAFKANPPQIDKDRDVGYGKTSYSHASLQNIANKAGKALSSHGLSFSWRTSQNNGIITVACVLAHEMGHCEVTSISAGADTSGSKNSIQAIGSTITYLQRYTLLAITGLATGEMDDDGQAGGDHVDNPPPSQKMEQVQNREGANRKPDLTKIQVWLDRLGDFKVGVSSSDELDKAWASAESKLAKMDKPERDYLQAEFEKKIELLENYTK